MAGTPPPNEDLAQLVALLGEDNVRTLVRTFLREYPALLRQLATGDRTTRQRMAHSLKSNTRIIGAHALSTRMAELEQKFGSGPTFELSAADVARLTLDFETVAAPLRVFADAA